jgi:hypothetical protein
MNNEQDKKEMRKTISFRIPPQKNKIPRNKPNKAVKYLYNANYKTLKKELKMTLENGKTCHVHASAESIL